MSVQKDPESVGKLSQKIRDLLDLYDDLASSQSPLKQAEQEAQDDKLNKKIKESLTEHQAISLT